MDVQTVTLDVVIPVWNEAEQLPFCVRTIVEVLAKQPKPFRLILVDDGSTDSTWAAIEHLQSSEPRVHGVRLSRNFGKEAALAAGLATSSAALVVTMDIDLQHPPALILEMLGVWESRRPNIVHARKADRGAESALRKLSANVYYSIICASSGFDLRGATDFKLLDRQAVEAYLALGETNVFFRGMVAWLGFQQERVDFAVPKRAGGVSRWTPWSLMKLAVSSTLAFSTGPLYIILLLGIAFCSLATMLAGKMLFDYFLRGMHTAGVPTIIAISLTMGGLTLVALAIIGLYIGKIYEEVKRRPRFLVSKKTPLLK